MSEMIKNSKYEILTEDGFKNFKGLKKSHHKEFIELKFTDGTSYKCSKTHQIKYNNSFISAEQITVGCIINNKVVSSSEIIQNDNAEFWDPVGIEDTASFVSKGMVHHNCDELAYIPKRDYEAFGDSVFPTMNLLIFKQFIATSTANGMNHFADLVSQAKRIDDYEYVTCSWRDVPRYDKNGILIEPDDYKEQTIRRFGEKFFLQTEACEFLGSSDTLVSGESLRRIQERTSKVSTIPQAILNQGEMYKTPEKGHNYVITCDPSKDGIDDFSVVVTDVTTFPFEQVFTAHLQVDYLIMPEHLNELGMYYNQGLMIIENNEGSGQSIADQLFLVYEYPNIYRDKNIDGRVGYKKYPGFRTTAKSRPLILNLMKIFIDEGKLIINSKETLNQLYTFTKRKDSKKFVAEDGYKDDAVMAQALVFAPFMEIKVFDDFSLFTKELHLENSEQNSAEFLSNLDVGFTSDDDDEPTILDQMRDEIDFENLEWGIPEEVL